MLESVVQWRLPLENCEANRDFVFDFVEWFHACAELEEHATECPDVRLKAQDAIQLLRRHIAKRTLVRRFRGSGLV